MAATVANPNPAVEEAAAVTENLLEDKPNHHLDMEVGTTGGDKGFLAKIKQPHVRDTIIWSIVALVVSLLYIFAFPCQPLPLKSTEGNMSNSSEWITEPFDDNATEQTPLENLMVSP